MIRTAISPRLATRTRLKGGVSELTRHGGISRPGGGGPSLQLRDGTDPGALAIVPGPLAPKLPDPAFGIGRILDAETVAKLGGSGRLVLDAREGFEFSGSPRGEWKEPSRKKAHHGYAPLRDSILAGLVIAGPGVARGNLGVVPMTSIAPTIARHLGIELSPLAGKPLDLAAVGANR